jgi:hypothetical protein
MGEKNKYLIRDKFFVPKNFLVIFLSGEVEISLQLRTTHSPALSLTLGRCTVKMKNAHKYLSETSTQLDIGLKGFVSYTT